MGPVGANFDLAFTFTHFASSRYGGRRLADSKNELKNTATDEDTEPLNFELARTGALWSRAEDFWHVVGWAFNCAVIHPKRWVRWQLWLEFMCDVLEDDWRERERRSESLDNEPEDHFQSASDHWLKESLIVKYISTSSGGYGRNRRILRAIFADGSATAVNELGRYSVTSQRSCRKTMRNRKSGM